MAEKFRYLYHPDHLGSTSYVTEGKSIKMKMIKKFLLLLLLVCCCKPNTVNNHSISGKDVINSYDSATGLKGTDGFREFFKRFAIDSMFQKHRIQFPLTYLYYADYVDTLISEQIKSEDWHYINFADDSLVAEQKVDAYDIMFRTTGSEQVEYVRTGIDNGINVTYVFRKEGKHWILTEIIDRFN